MSIFVQVAKVARKESNYKFADKTLKEHLHLLGLRDKKCDKSLIDLTNSYMETWGNGEKQWTIENTNALRELTNLLIRYLFCVFISFYFLMFNSLNVL